MLRIEVDESPGWADRLRDRWADLVDSMAFPTPFHSMEWLDSWAETVGRRAQPYVILVWQGNDLVGAAPMVRKRGPIPVIRSMAMGPSDYLHPLSRSDADGVETAIADFVRSREDLTFDFHQLREPAEWGLGFDRTLVREQAQCLALDLPPSYDSYLQVIGKSLRYDANRLASKSLMGRGAKVLVADESNVGDYLATFFDLHSARWRKRGLPGAFFGRLVALHRVWAPRALRRGMLGLNILEVDGKPAGAIYTMRRGSTCFFYQAGMDPSAKGFSPGSILVADAIRRSIEDGLVRFDFMRGDEDYKRRWMPQNRFRNLRIVRPAKGLTGTIAAQNMSLRAEIEDRVRARFEGGTLSKKPKDG